MKFYSAAKETLTWAALLAVMFLGITATVIQIKRERRVHQDLLALACWERWQKNGAYKPTVGEVESWIRAIIEASNDSIDLDTYLAIIDLESLGDPTACPNRDLNRSVGLAGINVATARGVCWDLGLTQPANMRRALYDPYYNCGIMVRHLEDLLKKYGSVRHAIDAYHLGEVELNVRLKCGNKGTTTYYTCLNQRLDEIEQGVKRLKQKEIEKCLRN
jgi:soluble lytic murein transglycosylase-like protein